MSSSPLSTVQKTFEYSRPMLDGKTIIENAWAKVPHSCSPIDQQKLMATLKEQLIKKDTVLVAHYYVDAAIQDLAMETGGIVADSLEMARFGRDHAASQLIVAGVRFMGETAKILSPGKTVLMPDLDANCSLDLGCPADDFDRFCAMHPERTVVVYANTSAAVKAKADWMVTSSCALPIIEHLKAQKQKILWAPDRHLGHYIQTQTSADMLIWDGACIVHDEFKAEALFELRQNHPAAKVLVHPESPAAVIAQADVVGSTSALLKAAVEGDANEYIVATDQGLLHRIQQMAPNKQFIAAPTAGASATCKSCAYCPWMAMNTLTGILNCIENQTGAIQIPEDIRIKALGCIQRMLNFTDQSIAPSSSSSPPFTPHLGAV